MKEFFAKLWQNKKLMWILGAACVALVVAAVVLAVVLGGAGGQGDTEPAGVITHTVSVKTEGGMAMTGLDVLVYCDNTLTDLVAVGKTDDVGLMQFDAKASDAYVLTLGGVARGYMVDVHYAVTGETTQIVLKTELLKEADLSSLNLGLGDVMFDFTVTAVDGTQYTLSQLLAQKKTVVLNFWFVGCDPCKAEFPYLQEAYDAAGEDIIVLAVSPVSDAAAISQFASAQGLTLPMANVAADWERAFGITAYPTTIVIDRFGTISLIHAGKIDDAQTFTDLFDFFTAEEYTQQTLASIDDIYSADGSQERPFEFGGVKEFEVTVDPGKVVYCDVYKVSGMELTIQDSDVYVLYDEQTHNAENGEVRFVVTSPDTFTPAKLGIGNSGKVTKIVKVTFAELPGTMGNPYTLEMGAFTVDIEAGNSQGVYYLYKAAEDGTVTMQCTAGTEGVKYAFVLYNLTTGAYRTLDTDGVDGVVSVQVHAGDELQFSASTLPNENNEYPAASLNFTAAFTAQAVEDATDPTEPGATEAPQSGGNSGSSSSGSNSGGSTSGGETDNTGNAENVGSYTELYKGQALNVGTGITNVTLTANALNYFLFTPTKSGTYQFTASETISYWGNNIHYIEQNQTSDYLVSDNVISLNIKESNLGSSYIFAVKAGRKVTSGTITVTRTGNAVLGIEDDPWVEYKGSHTPTTNFPASSGELTIVDITAPTSDYTLVKGSDGFYRLGSESGSIVYLDFDDTTRMGALKDILDNGIGVRAYVQKSGKTVKEDYTNLFTEYVACMDSNGRYPLTDDLIYILKNFGAQQYWWDVSKNGVLTGIVGLNKEIAWMCACYY